MSKSDRRRVTVGKVSNSYVKHTRIQFDLYPEQEYVLVEEFLDSGEGPVVQARHMVAGSPEFTGGEFKAGRFKILGQQEVPDADSQKDDQGTDSEPERVAPVEDPEPQQTTTPPVEENEVDDFRSGHHDDGA